MKFTDNNPKTDQLREMQKYREMGFLGPRFLEIAEGIRSGVDVSVYADKSYMSNQMHEARLALEEDLPIAKYLSPEIDAERIQEIRLALMNNPSEKQMELLNDPSLNIQQMRQARIGIEKNLDIELYVKPELDANVMLQFRYALEDGIKSDELKAYTTTEYDDLQVAEIVNGKLKGIDVEIYAKPGLDWKQMDQAKTALVNGLSKEQVEIFTTGEYEWHQMRQIRLGFESGVNAESYADPSMSSFEMMHKREEMEVKLASSLSDSIKKIAEAGEKMGQTPQNQAQSAPKTSFKGPKM